MTRCVTDLLALDNVQASRMGASATWHMNHCAQILIVRDVTKHVFAAAGRSRSIVDVARCATLLLDLPLLTLLAQWQYPTVPLPTVSSTTSLPRITTLTIVHRSSSDRVVLDLEECA